ncbi:palmitoyltransferase ZDHHC2/15/20, partial [Pancytospora epiphaga]
MLGDFLKHILRISLRGLYPLTEVYGYFVFCGIFCMEGESLGNLALTFQFVIYNFLEMIKIIIYLEMFVIDTKSTLDLFPHIGESSEDYNFDSINPFVANIMKTKMSETMMLCQECKTYKPPRAHHNETRGCCYLKFDHYCSIFDICIGFHNYKAFYQFLVVNLVSTIYFLVLVGIDLFYGMTPPTIRKVNYIISLSLFCVMGLINVYAVMFHTWLISNNETTIEHTAINAYLRGDNGYNHVFQEGPIKVYSMSQDRRVLNPYNLGFKSNWTEVF